MTLVPITTCGAIYVCQLDRKILISLQWWPNTEISISPTWNRVGHLVCNLEIYQIKRVEFEIATIQLKDSIKHQASMWISNCYTRIAHDLDYWPIKFKARLCQHAHPAEVCGPLKLFHLALVTWNTRFATLLQCCFILHIWTESFKLCITVLKAIYSWQSLSAVITTT